MSALCDSVFFRMDLDDKDEVIALYQDSSQLKADRTGGQALAPRLDVAALLQFWGFLCLLHTEI